MKYKAIIFLSSLTIILFSCNHTTEKTKEENKIQAVSIEKISNIPEEEEDTISIKSDTITATHVYVDNSKLLENEELIVPTYTIQHTEKLKSIILFCTETWDELYSLGNIRAEGINSHGIRGRYGMLKNEIGISILQNLIEEKVFIAGPHKDGMNYKSTFFGRYNPKFITKLYMELSELYLNREFVQSTQQLYDSQFKNYLRTYYFSYPIAANNKKHIRAYYKDGIRDWGQESFEGFADEIEGKGYDWYEGVTCPGFWVRRSIDGTSNHFFKLLKLILRTYDKEFLLNNKISEIKLLDSIDQNMFNLEESGFNPEW